MPGHFATHDNDACGCRPIFCGLAWDPSPAAACLHFSRGRAATTPARWSLRHPPAIPVPTPTSHPHTCRPPSSRTMQHASWRSKAMMRGSSGTITSTPAERHQPAVRMMPAYLVSRAAARITQRLGKRGAAAWKMSRIETVRRLQEPRTAVEGTAGQLIWRCPPPGCLIKGRSSVAQPLAQVAVSHLALMLLWGVPASVLNTCRMTDLRKPASAACHHASRDSACFD